MDTCVEGGATVITEGCKQESHVPSQPTTLQSLCDDPLLLQHLVVREKLREFDQDIHLESPLIEPCLLVEWNRLRRVFSSDRIHFRLKKRVDEKPLILVVRPVDGISSLIANTTDIREVEDLKKMPPFVKELLIPQETTKDSGGYALISYDPAHGWILLGCLSSMEPSPPPSPLSKKEHTADDDVNHFIPLREEKGETELMTKPQTVVYCSTDELELSGEKAKAVSSDENVNDADETLSFTFSVGEDDDTLQLASPPQSPTIEKTPFQEKRSNFKVHKVCTTCNQEVLKELLSPHMAKQNPSNWIRCAYCAYTSYEVDDIKAHTAKEHAAPNLHEDEHESIQPPKETVDSTVQLSPTSCLSPHSSDSPQNPDKSPSLAASPSSSVHDSTPETPPTQPESETLDSPISPDQSNEILAEVRTPVTRSRSSFLDLELFLSPLAQDETPLPSTSKRLRFKLPSPESQSGMPRRLVTSLFSSEATEEREAPNFSSPLTRSKLKSLSTKAQSQVRKSVSSETSHSESDEQVAESNSNKKNKKLKPPVSKRQPSNPPLGLTLSSLSDFSHSEATDSPKKKRKKSSIPRFKKNTSGRDYSTSLSDRSQSEEAPVERVTRSKRNSQLPPLKSRKVKKGEDNISLRCDICYKTFNFLRSFEVHMETHDPLKKKQCGHCPYSTSLVRDLKKHIRFRHPDVSDLSLESIVSSDAVSDIASSSFLSDDDCSEESFIVRTTSDSKSSSSPSSSSDLRDEPNVSSTRREWLFCPHCDYKSQRPDYFQIHLDKGHPDKKKTRLRSAERTSAAKSNSTASTKRPRLFSGSSSSSSNHTPKRKSMSRLEQTPTSDSSNRTPKRDAASRNVTALCPTCDEQIPVAIYIQHVAEHRMVNRNDNKTKRKFN